MDSLVAEINRALRARGWSARQASLEAVDSPELIRDMRRGRLPSVERLRALCDVLDFEFYIGPRRPAAIIDERRLEDALEAAERTLKTNTIDLAPREKARAVAAIYELLDREREPATAARMKRLIEVLSSAGHQRAEHSED